MNVVKGIPVLILPNNRGLSAGLNLDISRLVLSAMKKKVAPAG